MDGTLFNGAENRQKIVKIFVGAPPRSGNTYLHYTLRQAYSIHVSMSNNHSTLPVLDMLHSRDPYTAFIVPVREPAAAVKSLLVFEVISNPRILSDPHIQGVLERYTSYWELVLSDPELFCVVDFNILTTDRDLILKKLNLRYPSLEENFNEDIPSDELIKANLNRDDWTISKGVESAFLARGHLPRSESEYKKIAEEKLSSSIFRKRFEYLNSLYKELLAL